MTNFKRKRKGAVAFEFIIILVIFVATMVTVSPWISNALGQKTEVMSNWVAGCDEDPAGVSDASINGASYYDTHTQSRYCPR